MQSVVRGSFAGLNIRPTTSALHTNFVNAKNRRAIVVDEAGPYSRLMDSPSGMTASEPPPLPPSPAEEAMPRVRFRAGSTEDSGDPLPTSAPPALLQCLPSLPSVSDSPQPPPRTRTESTRSAPNAVGLVFNSSADDFQRSSTRGPRKVRRYYRRQSALMRHYDEDTEIVQLFEATQSSPRIVERFVNGETTVFVCPDSSPLASPLPGGDSASLPPPPSSELSAGKRERILAKLSLVLNVALLVAKTAAVVLSGSLSIISSLVDSAVDITSGLVIWQTSRAIANRDPYLYPRGRTRLEPLALVIISVVMAVASVQMIIQSSEAIIRQDVNPDVGLDTILIMVFTILTKLGLAIACMVWGKGIPSVAVLAQDHRNDCVSNSVAIACAYLASQFWVYLDPIGAIAVSLYIAFTWFWTGYGQIVILSGRTAKPAFINRILKICLEHDDRIECMDTVYVYHYGTKYLVEVHVVMDRHLSLMETHDISEPLQLKLEALPYVERAFVHVDYESEHRPEDEHKVV